VAAAAFYDLEGTLVSTNLVHTLGFYARNQPNLFRSFAKSTTTLLSVPLFAVSDQYSRKVFNDLFFKRYKGETEDRMRYFADQLFVEVLPARAVKSATAPKLARNILGRAPPAASMRSLASRRASNG
jgi:hypothetical protein